MHEKVEIVQIVQNKEFVIGTREYDDKEFTFCHVYIDTNKLNNQSDNKMSNIATTILMFSGISEKEAQSSTESFMKDFFKEGVPNEHEDILIHPASVNTWIRKNMPDAEKKELLPCGKFLVSYEASVSRQFNDNLEDIRGSQIVTIDFPTTLEELMCCVLKLGNVASYIVKKFQKL